MRNEIEIEKQCYYELHNERMKDRKKYFLLEMESMKYR